MEARLARPRLAMYAAMAAGILALLPYVNDLILVGLPIILATYSLLTIGLERRRRPEYFIAASMMVGLIVLGLAVAITGGLSSPLLVYAVVPVVSTAPRFAGRVTAVAGALAIAVMTVAALLGSAGSSDQDPGHLIAAAAAVVAISAFAATLTSAEMRHRDDAVLDPLTGLLNRKSLPARFEELRQQAALNGDSVSLVLCDLDHFKSINDRHGHDAGDRVLQGSASALRSELRTFELLYRVGGEEFLVVLPGRDAKVAAEVAERMRAKVTDCVPAGIHLTASFGVSSAAGDEVEWERMYGEADAALYAAKRSGRDQVVRAPAPPVTSSRPALAVPARATL